MLGVKIGPFQSHMSKLYPPVSENVTVLGNRVFIDVIIKTSPLGRLLFDPNHALIRRGD